MTGMTEKRLGCNRWPLIPGAGACLGQMHPTFRAQQQCMGMRMLERRTHDCSAPPAPARGRAPVGPVRGAHDDDVRARLQPVHQRQQLRYDATLHLTLRPTAQAIVNPVRPLCAEGRLCLLVTPLLTPQTP